MTDPKPNPLSALLELLARLYAAEPRPAGPATAAALRAAALLPLPQPAATAPAPVLAQLRAALAIDPHPGREVIAAALPHVAWCDIAGAIAALKPAWSAGMLVSELLGPTGQFHHPSLRVGLYVQWPGVHYGLRTHPAEETYCLLGGRSYWATGHAKPRRHRTGDIIHHPSLIPHQTLTRAAPLVAAWRWSGDIAFEGYAALETA